MDAGGTRTGRSPSRSAGSAPATWSASSGSPPTRAPGRAPCSGSSRKARGAAPAWRRGPMRIRVDARRDGDRLRRPGSSRSAAPRSRSTQATYDAARAPAGRLLARRGSASSRCSTSPSSVVIDAQRSLLDPGPRAHLAVQRRQPVRGVLVRRGARRRRGDGRVRLPRRDAGRSCAARSPASKGVELADRREADRDRALLPALRRPRVPRRGVRRIAHRLVDAARAADLPARTATACSAASATRRTSPHASTRCTARRLSGRA